MIHSHMRPSHLDIFLRLDSFLQSHHIISPSVSSDTSKLDHLVRIAPTCYTRRRRLVTAQLAEKKMAVEAYVFDLVPLPP